MMSSCSPARGSTFSCSTKRTRSRARRAPRQRVSSGDCGPSAAARPRTRSQSPRQPPSSIARTPAPPVSLPRGSSACRAGRSSRSTRRMNRKRGPRGATCRRLQRKTRRRSSVIAFEPLRRTRPPAMRCVPCTGIWRASTCRQVDGQRLYTPRSRATSWCTG